MPDAKYLILGNSAAALAAIETIRQEDAEGQIVVVSKEDAPCYSRVALPYLLSGRKRMPAITLREPDYYQANRIQLMNGVGATSIDPKAKSVALDNGKKLSFEKLLIATGSLPSVPPIQGINEADVCYHWTLADTRKIDASLKGAKKCVVIGAGFISLLTVTALMNKGLEFTIVEIADQVMPQLLDRPAAAVLEGRMAALGMKVIKGQQATAVEKQPGKTGRVVLGNGQELAADIIVCGTGVRPNADFLKGSGIEMGRGVLVDAGMRASAADIFAAGDVAEGFDFFSGERAVHAIWPTAIDQGRIAGANMTGASRQYDGSLSMNVTELCGLACASIGEFRDVDGLERIVYRNESTGVYRKLLLNRENRLQGAVVIGHAHDVQDMGIVHWLIKRKADVSPIKDRLGKEKVNWAEMVEEQRQALFR